MEGEVSPWACLWPLFPARCAMVLVPELPIRLGCCVLSYECVVGTKSQWPKVGSAHTPNSTYAMHFHTNVYSGYKCTQYTRAAAGTFSFTCCLLSGQFLSKCTDAFQPLNFKLTLILSYISVKGQKLSFCMQQLFKLWGCCKASVLHAAVSVVSVNPVWGLGLTLWLANFGKAPNQPVLKGSQQRCTSALAVKCSD